jgi:chromosome segregation ATPase
MTHRDEVESEIRALKEHIEEKQEELEKLENSLCDECDEWGKVEGRVYGNEIDQPMEWCPNCRGTKVKI